MKKRFLIGLLTALSTICMAFGFSSCSIADDLRTGIDQLTCKHEYGEAVVTVESTCVKKGESEKTCTLCGKVAVEKLDYAEHLSVVTESVEPTCTSNGFGEGVECLTCGEVLVEAEVIPMLGHLPVVDEAVQAACGSVGKTEGSHCSRCDTVVVSQKDVIVSHVDKNNNGVCENCNGTIFDNVTYEAIQAGDTLSGWYKVSTADNFGFAVTSQSYKLGDEVYTRESSFSVLSMDGSYHRNSLTCKFDDYQLASTESGLVSISLSNKVVDGVQYLYIPTSIKFSVDVQVDSASAIETVDVEFFELALQTDSPYLEKVVFA